MGALPLYLSDAFSPDTFEAVLMVLQVVKAIIGIGIAYIAYQGYRSNQSRPMLYLAAGFILVLGVPFFLYLGGLSLVAIAGLPSPAQGAIVATAELSQIAGLVAIVYALKL